MTASELRQFFLDFFKMKGHAVIPSASLIPPETDPTVLFTTAGMHPLVPYLLGEKHPGGNRVASVQKCVRTVDIDEVGDNCHLTFFEMMGNWSFGDYFKREAIEWSWEFLTDKKWLGINPKRITITVFEGDPSINSGQVLRDEESAEIWKSLGIPENKIFYKGREDNWWGPAGAVGPCGPDTEIFIDGVEVWNDVFMQYNRQLTTDPEGSRCGGTNGAGNQQQYEYVQLKQKNVDTGMGLERIAMIMQGKKNVYETDLFLPIIEKISEISSKIYQTEAKSYRIIADHIKASVFIIADGVTPLNVGRGYVLRRLIRRAVRHGKLLGIENDFTKDIAQIVIKMYKDFYPELNASKDKIFSELKKEENKFRVTLEKGLKQFEKVLKSGKPSVVSGKVAFDLYQTYGFPLELTRELAEEEGLGVDEKGFQEEYQKHRRLSKTAAAGQFKGGLAEASEATARLHTATHLLLAALREVLGSHVYQKGSNITPERLRLDFAHNLKLTQEDLKKAENRVNEIIRLNVPVTCGEMTIEEAKKTGAIGVFGEKYGNKVKVYSVKDLSTSSGRAFSAEICGGPHAKSTGELGHFRIIKEEASSAGVRRIKAVLEWQEQGG
jgi:alanyl-tRNA synthetase